MHVGQYRQLEVFVGKWGALKLLGRKKAGFVDEPGVSDHTKLIWGIRAYPPPPLPILPSFESALGAGQNPQLDGAPATGG